jgi:iron complex transport system substrate-binding protein
MRIVSLLASATEMIAALGCLDQLVGRSHECDYPSQVTDLPLVSTVQVDIETSSAQIDAQIKTLAREKQDTNALKALSIYAIDIDLLRRLQPDLIFTQTQCEVCAVSEPDVTRALAQLTGLQPRIVSLAPYRLNDVWEDLLRVGEALGRPTQARALLHSYQQRLEQLAHTTNRLSQDHGGRPRVAILEWLDPLMGAGNWTPELVACAGGEPLFGEVGLHSPWLTWEELRAADPDVLILAPCGFTLERTCRELPLLQRHSVWPTLKAVREQQVYAIDGNAYLNRSGPRLVESAELLGRTLWGEHLAISVDEQGWMHVT